MRASKKRLAGRFMEVAGIWFDEAWFLERQGKSAGAQEAQKRAEGLLAKAENLLAEREAEK